MLLARHSRLLLLAMVLVESSAACNRAPAAPPRKRAAPPARGLAAGHPALAGAVRGVVADCQLSTDGRVQACGSEAEVALVAAERAAGAREALRTYCRALEESAASLRALCAARIARLSFAGTLRRAASAPLLDCLVAGVRRVEPPLRPALARAAGLMAPALKREEAVLRDLGRSPALRAAVLQALFANGRLRVLPALQKLLASERDPAARLAIVRGLGEGSLEAAEVEPVCGVLRPLLTAREPALAGAAAVTHAGICLEEGDRLLEAAEQMAGRSGLTLEYLTAVRAVNGLLEQRGSAGQKKRSVALLGKLARDGSADEALREAALDHLSAIDRLAAVRVARRLRVELGPAPRRPASGPSSRPLTATLRARVELLLEKP